MRILNLIVSLLWVYLAYQFIGEEGLVSLELMSGIIISLKLSALSTFFALLSAFSLVLISLVGFKLEKPYGFYVLLQTLVGAIFLILYANDYLLFFIGWEIMGISSYFLLANTLSKVALIKYIIFTIGSAFALLFAILILYGAGGSFLYTDAYFAFTQLDAIMKYIVIIFMLLAMFIKIGAIGVHYWLVDAYEQSDNLFTPYLSAVVSKMSVYGIIIFLVNVLHFTTESHLSVSYILATVGVLSSVIATFKAINENEMKRLLAYSSIAQLGYIVTALSLSDAFGGALYHSLIHTLIKLLLFINVASIIYVSAKTNFSSLGGLIYKMPQSFVLLLIGIIVLAGMPPLGGFSSKFLIYASLLEGKYLFVLVAMLFASASAFLYVYKLIYGIYLGHPTSKKVESLKEVPFIFLIPQYIIAAIVVFLGVAPSSVVPYLNTILNELGAKQIPFEGIYVLHTSIAEYNGFMVMSAFVIIFALVLLFLSSLKSRKKEAKNRFDVAYCAEEPTEATHLHYGFSMGQELHRIGFVGVILRNSSKHFYNSLANQTYGLSKIFRKIYTGNILINFQIATIFMITLLWWASK